MTQEQALETAKQLFPNIADRITVSRERSIGFKHGSDNEYWIWDHSSRFESIIMGSSTICWEQALDEAKAKYEAGYTVRDTPFEDEQSVV